MSMNIFHKTSSGTGTLQKIAGHTVILDANVSEMRSGNFSISITSTANYFRTSVTFSVPMPDTDYIINLEPNDAVYIVSNVTPLTIDQKTVNGFRISWYGQGGVGQSAIISGKYYAFKPIKMDGYTELQNKVNNLDNVPTENSDNLVKSGGVYEALSRAGSMFTGTQEEWDALSPTEQEKYKVVCITNEEEGSGIDIYSTTETKTNKIWVDNKPIYRKCWSDLNIGTNEVNIGTINDVDAIVNIEASISQYTTTSATTLSFKKPYVRSQAEISVKNNNVLCKSGSGFDRINVVAIEYTKN